MAFFVVRKKVHWSDGDAAGIAWFPNYLGWFEDAEEELFAALGPARGSRCSDGSDSGCRASRRASATRPRCASACCCGSASTPRSRTRAGCVIASRWPRRRRECASTRIRARRLRVGDTTSRRATCQTPWWQFVSGLRRSPGPGRRPPRGALDVKGRKRRSANCRPPETRCHRDPGARTASLAPRVAPSPAAEGWHGWDDYAPFYDWENARTLGRRDVPFWLRR